MTIHALHLQSIGDGSPAVGAILDRLGLDLVRCVVRDRTGFNAALRSTAFDLILSDWRLPSYDALTALKDARTAGRREPFIIISGTVGEAEVVEAFEAGITDFVHTERIGRLAHVIRRAIDEARERQARIDAECQRFASDARFHLLFEANLAGVAIHEMLYDSKGEPSDYRFLEVNPAFEQLTGLRSQDLIGRTVREAMPQTEDMWIQRYGHVVDSGTPAHFEDYSAVLDRWFEVMAFRLSVRQFAVVCSDITIRKNAERDRLRIESDLRLALDQAQAASVAKSNFLSTMSHEIRTPLSGIIGMTDMLRQTELSQEQTELTRIIQDCGQGLLAVIGDVLDLAKIESGNLVVECRNLDPRHLVAEVQGVFSTAAMAKGLRLTVSVDPGVPARLLGDAVRLRQVLINLVGNAVKFTESGEIALVLQVIARDGERWVLSWEVSDTGPGIPDGYLPHLFEPFSQADATSSRRHGGTGLGLSIAKRLSDLMGGSLTVESNLGQGSRFRFTIPLQAGNQERLLTPLPLAGPDGRKGSPQWHRQPSVLVVEDDATCQFTFHMMLTSLGCAYSLAEDGNQAVAAVAEGRYDLVLMDCQMPVCDGYTATRIIRERSSGPHRLPIVAISANVFTEDRERCREAGMDDFLAKPCSLESLRACVEKWTAGLAQPATAAAR